MSRLAAVGDLHFGRDARGQLGPRYRDLADEAGALLLAGDLSRRGRPEEAEGLVEEFERVSVPVVAVLGNHDHESGDADGFRRTLEDGGITVLEGESTVVELDGLRVGIAGGIGFGGGFPGGTCADFGETENKAFVARGRTTAASIRQALEGLTDVDVRVALMHYSPIRATLEGENPEIYPFLGSHFLEDAVDRGGAHLAIHGHAHHGSEHGRTASGVPVRNVAEPVIGAPYRVFDLSAIAEEAA